MNYSHIDKENPFAYNPREDETTILPVVQVQPNVVLEAKPYRPEEQEESSDKSPWAYWVGMGMTASDFITKGLKAIVESIF